MVGFFSRKNILESWNPLFGRHRKDKNHKITTYLSPLRKADIRTLLKNIFPERKVRPRTSSKHIFPERNVCKERHLDISFLKESHTKELYINTSFAQNMWQRNLFMRIFWKNKLSFFQKAQNTKKFVWFFGKFLLPAFLRNKNRAFDFSKTKVIAEFCIFEAFINNYKIKKYIMWGALWEKAVFFFIYRLFLPITV